MHVSVMEGTPPSSTVTNIVPQDKYQNLTRILKNKTRHNKLWNMRVTMIAIVIGALGIVSKSMEKRWEELENEGRIETIQTTAFLKSARILKDSWRHE